jgi:hypothetical protein
MRGNPLDIGDLQAHANSCNALIITRNEKISGSSPLVGYLFLRVLLAGDAEAREEYMVSVSCTRP